jgi:hypothetical protein
MNSLDSDPFRAPLSDEDFFALNAVKAHAYSFVAKARIERLIAIGLVKEGLAGLRLTDAGEIRVAAQK